jgi:hypothetical protein
VIVATRFRRSRGGVVVTFHPDEAPILANLIGQLLEVLGDSDAEAGRDPLEVALGISGADTPPDDPALARLFPDAYAEDSEASADFRRYTESGLRDGKRAAAHTALETLAEPGVRRTLNEDQAHAWLTVLNDLRLVLGTRLDVTEEWDEAYAALPEDDPRRAGFSAYDWLTMLQETLVRALW